MNFYTCAFQYGAKVLTRGIKNGRRFTERADFSPVLFVKAKEPTKYKSLYGDYLQPLSFTDNKEAKEFVQQYKDVENFPIYGQTNYGYQYLTTNYPGEVQWDMSKVKIWTIDIETSAEFGFPDVGNPVEEILLITIKDLNSGKIITWGTRPFINTRDDVDYRQYANEKSMMQGFIQEWATDQPDVVTGWNCELFDIPYIVSRVERIMCTEDDNTWKKKFSPWGLVRRNQQTIMGREYIKYDITGVAVLDYLDLYKKFTYTRQESYKLDHIAKEELGKTKLEHGEYETFREFYTKDWQKFVEYNIIDTELVDELEHKLKLIELCLTMAYDAKCNYQDVFSQVRTWDCLIYNHLHNKNIQIPQKRDQQGRGIEGAFVKEPKPGKYEWVVSFDATSLYPSIIMQYNMSPETFRPMNAYDTTVNALLDGQQDFSKLYDDDLCMAANGFCYTRDKQGLFPEIVEKFFDDRQRYKKLMIKAQQEFEKTKDPKLKNDISKFNNFQMARKIQLNSLFGAMGNEYFRYYDARIAEGITMTGQYIIRHVGNGINNFLNRVCGTDDHDYSFYSDTDSCYISLEPLVDKFYPDMDRNKLINVLDKICEEKITDAINQSCDVLADYTNAFQKKIIFKREAIAERGIWVAKKRYALNVWDNEGVRYESPKLKVMGLEIVKSSTPAPVRVTLKEAVRLTLTEDEKTLQKYIEKVKADFDKLTPEEIAFPRGCNGINKYASRTDIYSKGTPLHVRGALLFNHHLEQNKLTKKYETIQEGEKIKYLYMIEPNTLGENAFSFISKLPPELDIHKYVDYDTMFKKAFLDPLSQIIDGLGWTTEPQATLEDLFG